MANYVQLSNYGDGTIVGQDASDKVGFFGKTPVVQQATIATGGDTTTEFTAAIDAIIADVVRRGFFSATAVFMQWLLRGWGSAGSGRGWRGPAATRAGRSPSRS